MFAQITDLIHFDVEQPQHPFELGIVGGIIRKIAQFMRIGLTIEELPLRRFVSVLRPDLVKRVIVPINQLPAAVPDAIMREAL